MMRVEKCEQSEVLSGSCWRWEPEILDAFRIAQTGVARIVCNDNESAHKLAMRFKFARSQARKRGGDSPVKELSVVKRRNCVFLFRAKNLAGDQGDE